MIDTSTLAFIGALVGIALTCLVFSLLRRQESRFFWQRPGVTWAGMGLLLLILSACSGGATGSTPQTTPTITSLALTPPAQPTGTPNGASTRSTDWTTYHRDNRRTGYIASTPDARSLTRTWQRQLDGAVYAEPTVVGEDVRVGAGGAARYQLA